MLYKAALAAFPLHPQNPISSQVLLPDTPPKFIAHTADAAATHTTITILCVSYCNAHLRLREVTTFFNSINILAKAFDKALKTAGCISLLMKIKCQYFCSA